MTVCIGFLSIPFGARFDADEGVGVARIGTVYQHPFLVLIIGRGGGAGVFLKVVQFLFVEGGGGGGEVGVVVSGERYVSGDNGVLMVC